MVKPTIGLLHVAAKRTQTQAQTRAYRHTHKHRHAHTDTSRHTSHHTLEPQSCRMLKVVCYHLRVESQVCGTRASTTTAAIYHHRLTHARTCHVHTHKHTHTDTDTDTSTDTRIQTHAQKHMHATESCHTSLAHQKPWWTRAIRMSLDTGSSLGGTSD